MSDDPIAEAITRCANAPDYGADGIDLALAAAWRYGALLALSQPTDSERWDMLEESNPFLKTAEEEHSSTRNVTKEELTNLNTHVVAGR